MDSSIKNTYYCTLGLDERHDEFLRNSMDELFRHLSDSPMGFDCPFHELVIEHRTILSDVLEERNDIFEFFALSLSKIRKKVRQISRLFILCPTESKIAYLAKKECPNAVWGFSNTQVSATYSLNNKYIVWHELLHLFEVDDCHCGPEKPGPTCELTNCIMQYAPTPQTVGEWPFLCQKNIKRIQSWSKNDRVDVKDLN